MINWKVATWLVALGMSVASRKSPTTSFLPRNTNRSRAYAAIVPMKIVPTSETTSTIVVLTKPSSISPLVKAVTKLSKLSQFSGRSNGPVEANSELVFRLANSTTDSGSRVNRAPTMRLTYFAVVGAHALEAHEGGQARSR